MADSAHLTIDDKDRQEAQVGKEGIVGSDRMRRWHQS